MKKIKSLNIEIHTCVSAVHFISSNAAVRRIISKSLCANCVFNAAFSHSKRSKQALYFSVASRNSSSEAVLDSRANKFT